MVAGNTIEQVKVSVGPRAPARVLFSPAVTSALMLATPWLLYLTSWYVAALVNGLVGTATRILLPIIGFAYFYAAIQFDPHQQAEIIRKQGGYIPGIRPGPPTERHLQNILNRITLPGALFLAFIALLPSLFLAFWNITRYPFAGTTLLIAVGVALETMKQIDSQLMMRNYEGFLK